MRKRNLILGGLAVFIGLGAVGAATGGSTNAADTTAAATTPPVAATTAPATTDATTAPSAAPDAAGAVTIGQPVKVDDDLTVTVLDAKYSAGSKYLKPAKGYVYMGLKVRYEASNEAIVSSGDWNVLADGTKQGHWAIVGDDAWEPALTFDTLTAGATTEGWITFEVPKPTKDVEVRFDNKLFTDDAAQIVLKVQAS